MHPIIDELKSLIERNHWESAFLQAYDHARATGMQGIERYRDIETLLNTLDALVTWTPRVDDPRHAFDTPIQFYFLVDQEPLRSLQSPAAPSLEREPLTPLSAWMDKFARVYGAYLDTPASAECVESFKSLVTWDDYMPPPSGYLTFNQFFARHIKPGVRPVDDIANDSVLVAPADSTFIGSWQISEDDEIIVDEPLLDIKGLRWSIHQLLDGSKFADRFRGGLFMHSYLSVADYHRWHSPVRGGVLEARVIQGQTRMDVTAKHELVDGEEEIIADVVDTTGFQFVQTRGLIVLDAPIGLVACLPVGMALVSSVVITAEVGRELHKGEELGYFQFGGSDFVLVFEKSANAQVSWQPNEHRRQGMRIATANVSK
jgi:phosphatidylserine decarboxylase